MSTPANLGTVLTSGRAATELSDEELESQGSQAHATRNWVFLHGTAEQFARHTSRMLELEQEYLRRHPHRTWQGSGGAGVDQRSEAAALREALRAIVAQLEALAAEPEPVGHASHRPQDPVLHVLGAVATAPGGRVHKLEVHQAAREGKLERAGLAALYTAAPALLAVDGENRVITDAGRERLQSAGRRSGPRPDAATELRWVRREDPTWDDDAQRIVGGAPDGAFDLAYRPGDPVAGDWWAAVEPNGHVVGLGWMDVGWGEAEILLAVAPDARNGGTGSFVLEHLESEAAAQGLNYVYNTVRSTHPHRDEVADWLTVRGYRGEAADGPLRKHVSGPGGPAVGAMDPAPKVAAVGAGPTRTVTSPGGGPRPSADQGPGHEESGGYVDVDDHRY